MSSEELVLLTGATGLIGFRVLILCLRNGYRVRVALRSLAKKTQILSAPSIRRLGTASDAKHLSFIEIPDISIPSAFDVALQGVDYVIHVAAPIVSAPPSAIGADLAAHYLKPTTDACLHLLHSARDHHPSVKRIVLTNSLAALIDHVTDTDETLRTEATRASHIQQPPYASRWDAYTAAKVSTLNLTEQWVERERPAFDLVHIAPGHVFGPNELVADPDELLRSGTNRIILVPVTGGAYNPEPGVTIHLDDVAEAHVRSLKTSDVPGNRLYVLSSGDVEGTRLDECFDIVRKHFPEHVGDAEGNALRNNGSLPTSVFRVDASTSARLLGMTFLPYETQVRDAVAYYLECMERQKKTQLKSSS